MEFTKTQSLRDSTTKLSPFDAAKVFLGLRSLLYTAAPATMWYVRTERNLSLFFGSSKGAG